MTPSVRYFELILPLRRKSVFMTLPQSHQLVHIFTMYFVKILWIDCAVLQALLDYLDWSPNNNVDRNPVWHESNVIIENASSMEQRYRKAHHLFDDHLKLVDPRMFHIIHLFV